jgi:ribose transport system substrate-binding protein
MRNRTRAGAGLATAAAAAALLLALTGCTSAANKAGATDAAKAKPASSVKLALVPGGAHPYFQPWKEWGAKAKTDFGFGDVTFNETAGWDQSKQNEVLNTLVANGYNAIGIFGVSPTDINSEFKKLKGAGIAVGSLASCPAGDTNDADFCLSTDTQAAAYAAAKAAIDAMGGKGNLVHLTGNAVDSNTKRRMDGVQKAVDETNGQVKLLTTVTDIDKDLATAQKAVSDLLAAHGSEINAIVTTAYNPAVASADGIKKSGLPIKLIAIDDDPTIIAGIKDGSIYGTVVQNPGAQAYVGGWVLGQLATGACTMKQPGVIVDSGSFVVTKKNADTYDQERQDFGKKIKTKFQSELLTCK